ncbi:MAG TPA: pantoate--beta-alanine ligase [Actinomycetota bacterium]|nr:pantoate--beta-alanine ligase [Actinomycetota bacterium]
MNTVRTAAELRDALSDARRDARSIGFVPTMGALHAGHRSLLRHARAATDVVVLSVFVNPLQFGPREDFDAYPRTEKDDLSIAGAEGVDVVFLPSRDEMYPPGAQTSLSPGELAEVLEGRDRPGHFAGVATVVAKLFNLVQPDVAFFGQKDAQQVAVVRRLVRDLSYPIEIVVCPTVRDAGGLAVSSRNAYLSAEERTQATAIYRALELGRDELARWDAEAVEKLMWELLVDEGLQPSYAKVVDPDTFGPPSRDGPVLLAVAASIGDTRLIDNMLVERG